jgi:hypothetical protein
MLFNVFLINENNDDIFQIKKASSYVFSINEKIDKSININN